MATRSPIKRLSRFAETTFATLCAEAGVLCNESQEDENGWDCLAEFPPEATSGHPDTHPPAKRAFVQIKSTRNNRASCTVKLSNALKAAQSPDPWFVILVMETRGKPKIYAVHIWGDLFEKSLKAVRQATIDEKPLHQRRLTINFSNGDLHSDDLVEWMRSEIISAGPEYSEAKGSLYKTVGYGDGYGAGKVTFVANNANEIFDEFLGLGNGLTVSRFTYTPARFGLPDTRPAIDIKEEGRLTVTPTAAGDCELRMRGSQPGQPISLPAKIYTLGMPWLPFEKQRFRVSAIGFEIVWANNGDSKFNARLDFEARVPLSSISRFATLRTWLEHGPVDVQVWAKSRRMVGGVLNADPGQQAHHWKRITEIIDTLRSLNPNTDAPELCLSVVDINAAARNLYLMHQVVSAR